MARAFQIAVIGWLSVCVAGCTPPAEDKPWEKVKIGDIAPSQNGQPKGMPGQPLKTINFDAHIFEIPAENIGKLKDIRRALYTTSLRFSNYDAFKGNLFSVRYGQIEMWNKTLDLLRAAGGQQMIKVSLLLPDGQPSDLAVTGLDRQRAISYVSSDLSRETATIGPGVIALRIKAEKIPDARGACDAVAYPVFLPPIRTPVPQLAQRARLREFSFGCAGFGAKMSPGDFVVLGPEKYLSDQTALGGLFFSNPQGNTFFNETERKPPQRKPSVRIFLLVCTGINY